MLVTWIVAAGIIFFAQAATRKIKPVPDAAFKISGNGSWKVSTIFSKAVIGRRSGAKDLLVFRHHLHLHFVLELVRTHSRRRHGWLGPSRSGNGRFHVDRPLLRGGNADLNLTFAMACVFFVLWMILGDSSQRRRRVHHASFRTERRNVKGFLKVIMIVIFFIVGWLEIVSILFRPISLSFRLYGNIYAGENMLEVDGQHGAVAFLADPDSVLFHGTAGRHCAGARFHVLTAVFTLLIAQHEPGHEAHH